MFIVKTNVDDHSPDHVEVAKKNTAKRNAEDKNVSAHGIVTFLGVIMVTLQKDPSDQNYNVYNVIMSTICLKLKIRFFFRTICLWTK